MTTRIWSGTCGVITLALIAGLMAQHSDPLQGEYITVTGCIQRVPPTSRTGASETTFILNAQTSRYRLDADNAKLTPHVGHKVEIAGTVVQPPRTSPADPKQGLPPVRIPGRLKVDTIRMTAPTCQ